MRHDMFELLLERPRSYRGRHGRVAPSYPRGELRPRPLEDAPLVEAYGGHYRTKYLDENLAPLRRWLGAQVGRPWDRVFAEICEHLPANSAVKKHVRDHVSDFVSTGVVNEDGVLYASSPRYGYRPLFAYRSRRPVLWVCPRTGILRASRSPRPNASARALRDGRWLVRRKGGWVYVRTARLPDVGDRGRIVCAMTKLAVGSRGYRSARAAGTIPWSWEVSAVEAFVPGKMLLQALFREAEAVAIAARR